MPLFFDNIPISTEEVPQYILERQRFDSNYWAVLKKRFGHITADNFLKYARRFAALCDKIYQGSNFNLRINEGIPLGFAVFTSGLGMWEGAPGKETDINQLTGNTFRKIFAQSSSMVLDIRPVIAERDDILASFSRVEWTHDRPKAIFFYSQDGGRYDEAHNYHRGPLHDLLLRKMFYVSGVAPSLNFTVKLGVGAHLDEAEGKDFAKVARSFIPAAKLISQMAHEQGG